MSARRETILLLAPDLPYPPKGGGQMRMASIIKGLLAHGKVHMACEARTIPEATKQWMANLGGTIEAVYRTPMPLAGRILERAKSLCRGHNLGWNPKEQAALDQIFDAVKPSVVWLETPYMVRYALAWKGRARLVVDYWGTAEGAEREWQATRGWKKGWAWQKWHLALAGEKRFAKVLNAIAVVSDAHARYFRDLAPNVQVEFVPMSVEKTTLEQEPESIKEDQNCMIMTGDMSFGPNVDAAMFFCNKILPLVRNSVPEARVVLAGRAPTAEVRLLADLPGVTVTGEVPSLSDVIQRATIYVLPLRMGSGVRTKLFELFPLGKALVTTPIGAEGLDLENERNCLMSDTAGDFATNCVRLLKDKTLRTRLGSEIRRLATDVYTNENVAMKVGLVLDQARKTDKRTTSI